MDASLPTAPPDPKTFGHIPGIPVGKIFPNRKELMAAGVHGVLREGIHGDPGPYGGAYSICMSGGYEDDEDLGDKITYVGSGGQDPDSESRKQIADQSFEDPGNKALRVSCHTKRPVRVIRGKTLPSYYAPENGYRYDGLYVVDSAELRRGKQGFQMCFFQLRRIREYENDRPPRQKPILTLKELQKRLRNAPIS